MTATARDEHDAGLLADLQLIARQMERRRTLAWLAGIGASTMLPGCGGGGSSSSTTSSTSTTGDSTSDTTSGTSTSGTSGSSGSSTSTSSGTSTGDSCLADPTETSGPYPADGTNASSGSTSNVLTASGIVRSDIRSSFIDSTTVATGVQVSITITLESVSNSCAPLSGHAIYFWQCDREGHYSLYTAAAESYLRGVQETDSNGQVTFVTIFPACYDGRWPHMHFEVYSSLSAATSGKAAALTSQFAMPEDLAASIYTDTTTYPSSATNLTKVSLATDLVFGDNTTAQNTQMTPTFAGSASAGYTANVTVGL